MSSLISYRKEIDGLRALAVISVVIFHLKNSLLPGGFVGVDIFFVISGFLITKIIIREVEANRFSFTNFYIRRIRRIFPALFLVLFVSLILAILILTTEDMIWFAKTLRYAAIQISNFLFQREVGYFDPAFEDMPLLHTWSLAVEEQFHLIWPVTLLLLFKFKKNHNLPFYGLIVISTISLIFSEYLVNHNQKVAFFSLPSRLWELGVGGILAFHKIKQPKKSLMRH
jgi:peptidoglycan/LPS O-acetylase OafA/YrhL